MSGAVGPLAATTRTLRGGARPLVDRSKHQADQKDLPQPVALRCVMVGLYLHGRSRLRVPHKVRLWNQLSEHLGGGRFTEDEPIAPHTSIQTILIPADAMTGVERGILVRVDDVVMSVVARLQTPLTRGCAGARSWRSGSARVPCRWGAPVFQTLNEARP